MVELGGLNTCVGIIQWDLKTKLSLRLPHSVLEKSGRKVECLIS